MHYMYVHIVLFGLDDAAPAATLSEAIGSLGCRRNSSSGSVLIRQLTEP